MRVGNDKLLLDTANGTLEIGGLIFSAGSTISDLDAIKVSHDIEIVRMVRHAGNESYAIRYVAQGEYAVGVNYFQGRLTGLDIVLGRKYNFPPFEMTDEEKKIVFHRLMLIGGESRYVWGSVAMSIDPKGGIVSILIQYI